MPNLQIPSAFKELFEPYRYKTYYGGRGGAKSHNIARALLAQGMEGKLRILCAREIQGSIADSVHKLLSDIINEYELNHFYTIQKNTIVGVNGTEFLFKGLKHNITDVKSTENVSRCWVEEAEKVSDSSWEVLIPTIRAEGSEIWTSFNPQHPTDPTYKRMVEEADENMLVRKVSWRDNPFFPDVLNQERIKLQNTDSDAYKHIWEGEFDTRHNGAIYATYLDRAREEGRITHVPHKVGLPVVTAWDLGKANATAIIFAQIVGLQPRIIDYYEATGDQADLPKLAAMLRAKPYEYSNHYLPHDAAHERLGMTGSIASQLRSLGIENQILKVSSVEAGIELSRDLINEAWIDQTNGSDLLHALMHYHYEYDNNRQRFKNKPEHDWSSDPADAFRYLAQALAKMKNLVNNGNNNKNNSVPYHQPSSSGWMG